MFLLKLILKNAFRHRLRSLLTVAGIAVAILAFGLLRTVLDTWHSGVDAASATRLVTRNAISLIFPLPLSYREKIRAFPGVDQVSFGSWFGGLYIDEKNFFPNFAVEAPSYLQLYPEYLLPAEEKASFYRDRKGCIVGRKTAKRFGWKVGDSVVLKGTIYTGDWEFVIRGVYRGQRQNTDETLLLFHWSYLDETVKKTMPARAGQVGFYMLGIHDADRAAEISRDVDEGFKNSLAETLTETEKAFNLGFVAMSEAILVIIRIVSLVVIVIILTVAANTMAMSARERSGEYAVLKTLGFGRGFLVKLLFGESLLISLAGCGLALALMQPLADAFGKGLEEFFPFFNVSRDTYIYSTLNALAVGLTAAVVPAWQSSRIHIAEAMRRIG